MIVLRRASKEQKTYATKRTLINAVKQNVAKNKLFEEHLAKR